MDLKFQNKKITGMLSVLPENEINFDDEIGNYNFSRGQSMKLKLILGYNKRRVVHETLVGSDLGPLHLRRGVGKTEYRPDPDG